MSEHLNGWTWEPLNNLAHIVSGGTPSRNVEEFWGEEINWVTPTDISKTIGNYINETKETISIQGLASCSASLVPKGTILLTSRATIGEAKIAAKEMSTNQGFKNLIPKDKVVGLFLFYQTMLHKNELLKLAAGSTFLEIGRKDIGRMRLPVPKDPKRQHKIAAILETVDEAIERTLALIGKYEQVKTGMMQDLFTRGLTPDGKLRPPRSEAPDLYQETSIGWIPKDWGVRPASELCHKIIDCKNRTPPVTAGGYPVIRTSNVRHGRFIDVGLDFTDHASYVVWTARGAPIVGDIVITREAPVGEVCAIPKRHPHACLGQRMMLYRTNPAEVDKSYFLHVLQSQRLRNYLDLISGGSTVGHVKVGEIRELPIPTPTSLAEQTEIAKIIERQADYLGVLGDDLQKLRQKKSGLMQDLLTGKVPVEA